MLEPGQRRDLPVLQLLFGVSMAEFVHDGITFLQTMVLFSNRNNFDISAWIPVWLAPTDVFNSLELPLEPMPVSVWTLQLSFMVLGVDGSNTRKQRSFSGKHRTELRMCVALSCRSERRLCLPGIDTARKATTRYDQSGLRCHSRP
jgi:hypothetical protein